MTLLATPLFSRRLCIYNLCLGARQQEYSEGTRRKPEKSATSVDFFLILVSKLLFSLRTERVSERRKRQTDRKDKADIVKLASVLPRSLSVNFILKAAIALDCNGILST